MTIKEFWIKKQKNVNSLYIIDEDDQITEEMFEEMKNYTKILFCFKFNQKIGGKIPYGITHLYFESIDNKPNQFNKKFEGLPG